MPSNQHEHICPEGSRVFGTYHGQPYTGTVEHGRPHTRNLSYLHYVVLDAPITVYGAVRERIIASIWNPAREEGTTTIFPLEDHNHVWPS